MLAHHFRLYPTSTSFAQYCLFAKITLLIYDHKFPFSDEVDPRLLRLQFSPLTGYAGGIYMEEECRDRWVQQPTPHSRQRSVTLIVNVLFRIVWLFERPFHYLWPIYFLESILYTGRHDNRLRRYASYNLISSYIGLTLPLQDSSTLASWSKNDRSIADV